MPKLRVLPKSTKLSASTKSRSEQGHLSLRRTQKQKFMPQKITDIKTNLCDGIQSIITQGESVRFFAPLKGGERVKDFTVTDSASCAGLHVGINEAGRKGLICFYFVEFPDKNKQEFRSGIVLLSLIREPEQLATLFNPEKLASLLRCDVKLAEGVIESLKNEFLSFQRLKLMYGIYQLMKV